MVGQEAGLTRAARCGARPERAWPNYSGSGQRQAKPLSRPRLVRGVVATGCEALLPALREPHGPGESGNYSTTRRRVAVAAPARSCTVVVALPVSVSLATKALVAAGPVVGPALARMVGLKPTVGLPNQRRRQPAVQQSGKVFHEKEGKAARGQDAGDKERPHVGAGLAPARR